MSAGPDRTLFVGSYAPQNEPGIYAFAIDEPAGEIRLQVSHAGIQNPSFVAVHPGGDHLFTVSETGLGSDGTHGAVHSLRIDRDGGSISFAALNHRSTEGDHPCHLAIDAGGRWLAVSNYSTGNVAVFPIAPDGSLGEMASFVQHTGSGPNPGRQQGPHAHSAVFSPDNRFLIVADLGIDRLVIYAFDADTGCLSRHGEVESNPGAGPRHMAFHPGAGHLFVVNELESSVTLYEYGALTGSLGGLQTLSTLPAGDAENTAAEIRISASGRHLYVSNRGHNSLAVYAFDAAGGLDRIGVCSSGGDWPRSFGLSPDGHHVAVANRYSNEIALLPLRAGGADIGAPVARVAVPQPSCIAFT